MQNKIITWLSFCIVTVIIILKIFGLIQIDIYSAIFVVLLSIPFISPYIESLVIFGNRFNFRKTVEKIEMLTNKAVEESTKTKRVVKEKNITSFPIDFSLETSKEIVDKDPTLALASLRIETDKMLSTLYNEFFPENEQKNVTLSRKVQSLKEIDVLSDFHKQALNEIISVGNQAVHGSPITKEEANKVIGDAERLAKSFI